MKKLSPLSAPVEIVRPGALPTTPRTDPNEEIRQGDWFWVTDKSGRALGCVTHLGSNYALVTYPGEQSERIHFDNFWSCAEREKDPDTYIGTQIAEHWGRAQELMGEIQALTARLGVSPRTQLSSSEASETKALSISLGRGPIDAYKKELVKAKDKTLPALFEAIEGENRAVATWMKAKIIPLKAKAGDMRAVVERIEDRIFSVELYAGLVETVTQVRKGAPADLGDPIHLMQRRCYMDEECLVGYEHGGMDYKNIKDFDRWLSKPANFNRVLPFSRTIVAFRVRRHDKERERRGIADFVRVMCERQYDEETFLFLRNGEQLFRFSTKIEFDEKLFPDQDQKTLAHGKLWARMFCDSVDKIVTDEQYQGLLEDAASEMEDEDEDEDDEVFRFRSHHLDHIKREYHKFSPESVHHDDIAHHVERTANKHNRLVLIVQGLLDRSPVFHPHPPWQLWTQAGFETGLALNFDDSRALSAGDKPDFEAYRAKLNAHIQIGSVTVGQELVWEHREAARENRRRDQFDAPRLIRHRPAGDPGPGRLAEVAHYRAGAGKCTYKWTRQMRVRGWRETRDGKTNAVLVTGEENVLCVDAYKPGDFHIFFDDPRTRAEYIQWAHLLLEAEECHAGNRKLKPKPPGKARKLVVRGHDRPAVELPKERAPKPPAGSQYREAKVMLRRSMTTTGGTRFEQGEILNVRSYDRRKLTLHDPKSQKRSISRVSLYDVTIVGHVKKKRTT